MTTYTFVCVSTLQYKALCVVKPPYYVQLMALLLCIFPILEWNEWTLMTIPIYVCRVKLQHRLNFLFGSIALLSHVTFDLQEDDCEGTERCWASVTSGEKAPISPLSCEIAFEHDSAVTRQYISARNGECHIHLYVSFKSTYSSYMVQLHVFYYTYAECLCWRCTKSKWKEVLRTSLSHILYECYLHVVVTS